jgi:hypothetical protein
MDELPWNPRAIYMKSLRVGQMTKLPLEHKGRYTPLRGNMVKTWISSSGGQAFAAVRVLLTQAPRSRRVSPFIEASRRARISSPPAEPPVLVLWLNQATRWFCGEPPQTPHADSGCEPLPCINSCPWLRLALCCHHAAHTWSPSTTGSIEPSLFVALLLRGPGRLRPFAPALHQHQRKLSRNLHLQYGPRVSPHHVVNRSSH